jgi:hypothetical protein
VFSCPSRFGIQRSTETALYSRIMITGTHLLLHSQDAEADRVFFRDILGFPCVDAGHGWLIFGMSPAEMAIHPLEGDLAQPRGDSKLLDAALYLMCDDLDAMIASLKAKKICCTEVEKARWGSVTKILLPSGGSIGLYQPRHKTALELRLPSK